MNVLVDAHEDTFHQISRRMAQMMDDMLNRQFVGFRTTETWQPPTNVYETPTHYVVCMDLAGVDHRTIDVRANKGVLWVGGHRDIPRPQSASDVRTHLMEIEHGFFRRHVEMPGGVMVDQIEASYRHGLLWIRMPKAG